MVQEEEAATPSATIPDKRWVRGVNIGGWLVLERYITPYQFAVTDCHLRGDFCWYPGQASAPPADHPSYRLCDLYQCHPFNKFETVDGPDYPMDEYTLGQAFANNDLAAQWLDYHFDNFITFRDIQEIKDSGLTHLRVPLPHWILDTIDDLEPGEPWIVTSQRWQYFLRLCEWCRQVGLQVWPDIHTAPGSQNGFDNSGQTLPESTCKGWCENPAHVQRSLRVIRAVTERVVQDGVDDIVTGFGLLNEPFLDCDKEVYQEFLEEGLDIVRETLGPDAFVYVGDMFSVTTFNDGHWFLDPERYRHTYMDSHFYQVFAESPRALTPRQHVAYVCQHQQRDLTDCCYEPDKTKSRGVQRMVGEFSAAVDTLPVAMLDVVMKHIAANGTAAYWNRALSSARQEFLKRFLQAQIVMYEQDASAWFFWTAKMEGGVYAEWDYLRALREGWLPNFPTSPATPSEKVFGTCYDIIFDTSDDISVVHEFPDPRDLPAFAWNPVIDDDVVVTHGDSLNQVDGEWIQPEHHTTQVPISVYWVVAAALLGVVARYYRGWFSAAAPAPRKNGYTEVPSAEI